MILVAESALQWPNFMMKGDGGGEKTLQSEKITSTSFNIIKGSYKHYNPITLNSNIVLPSTIAGVSKSCESNKTKHVLNATAMGLGWAKLG